MKRLVSVIAVLCFLSCGETYKLSSADLQYNPYRVGDKLIFRSNTLLFDTVTIIEIVRQKIGLGRPFDGNRDRGEGLSVLVKHSVTNPDSFPGRQEGSIFMMHNYSKGSLIDYWFTGHIKREAISNPFYVRDLETLKTFSYATKAGHFEDVILIKSDTVYPDIFDRLSKIYWSKKAGYLKIEVNETLQWELIKILPSSR